MAVAALRLSTVVSIAVGLLVVASPQAALRLVTAATSPKTTTR